MLLSMNDFFTWIFRFVVVVVVTECFMTGVTV